MNIIWLLPFCNDWHMLNHHVWNLRNWKNKHRSSRSIFHHSNEEIKIHSFCVLVPGDMALRGSFSPLISSPSSNLGSFPTFLMNSPCQLHSAPALAPQSLSPSFTFLYNTGYLVYLFYVIVSISATCALQLHKGRLGILVWCIQWPKPWPAHSRWSIHICGINPGPKSGRFS